MEQLGAEWPGRQAVPILSSLQKAYRRLQVLHQSHPSQFLNHRSIATKMNQQYYQQGQQYPGYGQVPQQMQAPIQQQQPQEKHHHHLGQKAGGVGKALMNAAVW
ncbi:hypothetical protein G7K_1965-t1 [Saitoella complicata NRRL Y-17804]|uniref:Uncharacterized protein n=1 Tax=Saitoella complicata (strain BCRC 22490 / CBS 7301 / JCM 7358 / NBRC 10748 / NRRL Y-17804) TaxID=698492 RepID=A0A0E9NDG0_SAICN|nr:hypothetical protein G7K_1965-t1 [Saitoella complicata NRRL Y-17804]